MAGGGLTGSETEVAGRVAGAVLAATRTQIGLTQERLAEQLAVGLTTVQAWESGRRALFHGRFSDLHRLQRHLCAAGTSAELLQLLDQALAVDAIYADIRIDDPVRHPLALVVPDRAVTELLEWPLTGSVPRLLHGTTARLDIPAEVRDAVAADLRAAVDRSARTDMAGAMVRRQVKYLVANNPASADWLREQAAADTRTLPDLRIWSPLWPVARSQAVTAAQLGNLDPLRRFIDQGLSHDQGIAANLNYWAYWVGEYSTVWVADADMSGKDGDWSGERLLGSLLDGVVHQPYRELCAHALWALLRQRGHLARHPQWRRRIVGATERALGTQELDGNGRRRLEQVAYLTESAG